MGNLFGHLVDVATMNNLSGGSLFAFEQYGLDMASAEVVDDWYDFYNLYSPSLYTLYSWADGYSLAIDEDVFVSELDTQYDVGLRYAGGVQGCVKTFYGSGTPIQWAVVSAMQEDPPYLGGGTAVTDASGVYAIYNLDICPGVSGSHYTLAVDAPGFTSQVRTGVWVDEPSQIYALTSVDDFSMCMSGGIYGTVRDANDLPIAGAIIMASPISDPSNSYCASTDSSGTFMISDVDGIGEYSVQCVADGCWNESASASVTFGSSASLNFVLYPAAVITGGVKDSNGDPVEGAMVYPVSSDDAFWSYLPVSTDADGNYELINVVASSSPDQISVMASWNDLSGSSGNVNVSKGQTVTGADIVIA